MTKPTHIFQGITLPYDTLLRGSQDVPIGLYHLHMATAEQLCRLHYSHNSIKHVKAMLQTLDTHHYIQADWLPTRRMRSPYYYVLDHKGVEYLRSLGLEVSNSFRASKEVDKNYLFIQHALELSDILISAALLKQAVPNCYLAGFTHERALKQEPYKVAWQGKPLSLIPDAFLDFRLVTQDGSQRRMPIILEHDRGTEEQPHFRRRIRAYIMLLKSEAYKDWLGVKSITIAFTTFVGIKRLEQMREWTHQELVATSEPKAVGLSFLFTTQSQPLDPRQLWLEPCWYTLFANDDPMPILEG